MSTDRPAAPRPLPDRPNLRHLKDQAQGATLLHAITILTMPRMQSTEAIRDRSGSVEASPDSDAGAARR